MLTFFISDITCISFCSFMDVLFVSISHTESRSINVNVFFIAVVVVPLTPPGFVRGLHAKQ